MFQPIPIPISQNYPPRYGVTSSPRTGSFPLLQSRIVTISPQRNPLSNSLKNVKLQNEKNLDLLSEQLKLVNELAEVSEIERFKVKIPSLLSNLQCMMDNILRLNKGLQDLIEPSESKSDKIPEEEQKHIENEATKKVEASNLALIDENNKMKDFIESLSKESATKDAKIESLKAVINEKEKQVETLSKLHSEKESIEKNLEKLVGLNEQMNKNYEEKVIELDTNKARCNVLMDINGELRESLDILLHENNKLNRILTGEFKKLKEEEEQD